METRAIGDKPKSKRGHDIYHERALKQQEEINAAVHDALEIVRSLKQKQ